MLPILICTNYKAFPLGIKRKRENCRVGRRERKEIAEQEKKSQEREKKKENKCRPHSRPPAGSVHEVKDSKCRCSGRSQVEPTTEVILPCTGNE